MTSATVVYVTTGALTAVTSWRLFSDGALPTAVDDTIIATADAAWPRTALLRPLLGHHIMALLNHDDSSAPPHCTHPGHHDGERRADAPPSCALFGSCCAPRLAPLLPGGLSKPPAASFHAAPMRPGPPSYFTLKAAIAAAAWLAATAQLKFPLLNLFSSGVAFGLGLASSGMTQQHKARAVARTDALQLPVLR